MSGNSGGRRTAARQDERVAARVMSQLIEQGKPTKARMFLRWLGPALLALFGLGGPLVTAPQYFWWWAVGFYVALLVMALDVVTERWRWLIKSAALMVPAVLALVFTYGIVLAKAPLDIRVYAFVGARTGSRLGGIAWRDEFADVRVTLDNGSEHNYEDLDVSVMVPELAIINVAQVGRFPLTGVSIVQDGSRFDVNSTSTDAKGSKRVEEMVFMGTVNVPYRILIEKLPKHTAVGFTVAVADASPMLNAMKDGRRIESSGGASTATFKAGELPKGKLTSFYGPRPKPTSVVVGGSYKAVFREVKIPSRPESVPMRGD
jgi:hypothetical protein